MKALTGVDLLMAGAAMSRGRAIAHELHQTPADQNPAPDVVEVAQFGMDLRNLGGPVQIERARLEIGAAQSPSAPSEGDAWDCKLEANYTRGKDHHQLDYRRQGQAETVAFTTPSGQTNRYRCDATGYYLLEG